MSAKTSVHAQHEYDQYAQSGPHDAQAESGSVLRNLSDAFAGYDAYNQNQGGHATRAEGCEQVAASFENAQSGANDDHGDASNTEHQTRMNRANNARSVPADVRDKLIQAVCQIFWQSLCKKSGRVVRR